MKFLFIRIIFLFCCCVNAGNFILAGNQEVRLWKWMTDYMSRTKNPPKTRQAFEKSLLAMRKNKGIDPETVLKLLREKYQVVSFTPRGELEDFDYSKDFFVADGNIYSKKTSTLVLKPDPPKQELQPVPTSKTLPPKTAEITKPSPLVTEIIPNPGRRNEIPSYNQSDGFKGGNKQCTVNSFVNSLKWWGDKGIITETNEKKIHKQLLKERGKGHKTMQGMANALKKYLGKYGNKKKYEFKIANVPVTAKNLSIGTSGENIATLSFDNSRGGGHMVTLTDYDLKTQTIYFNTWGKRFSAQLVKNKKKWLIKGFKKDNIKYYLDGAKMVIVIPSAKQRSDL